MYRQSLQIRGNECYGHHVTVTQQGQLSDYDRERLLSSQREVAEQSAFFQALCCEMVDKSSYRIVSQLTGISTNTLQRWKREAS